MARPKPQAPGAVAFRVVELNEVLKDALLVLRAMPEPVSQT